MGKKIMQYSILLLVLPITIIVCIGNVFYSRMLVDRISNVSKQNISLISSNISTLVDNIIAASNIIAQDQDVMKILLRGDASVADHGNIDEQIIKAQSSVLYAHSTDMVIYDAYNHYYSASVASSYQDVLAVTSQEWYQETMKMNGRMYWCYPDDNNLNFADYKPNGLCMARVLKSPSGKGYGVFLIYVDLTSAQNQIFHKSFSDDYSGTYYIVNDDNMILMCSDASAVGKPITDFGLSPEHYKSGSQVSYKEPNGERLIINSQLRTKGNFYVVHAIQEKLLLAEVRTFQKYSGAIIVFFFAIFIVATIVFARISTRPLTDMCISMQRVSQRDFSCKISVEGKGEIATVAQQYNSMIDEVQRLLKELSYTFQQKEEMRYKALQNQINPHFILNTLNAIKLLINMNRAEQASIMIVEFGKMLEHILNRSDQMISLHEEIDYITSYCTIQRMRYGNNFKLLIDCNADTLNCKVPTLLLQPIVENAIIHGISEMQGFGEISISAYYENGFAVILISDNGVGISETQVKEILGSKTSSYITGIGVNNVLERIKLVYGKNSGLSITSEEGTGTLVKIFLEIRDNPY